ncbi:MAG: PhzF family phenazine biosynthesis protein [Devosia sp.]
MSIDLYQIVTFATDAFAGNPAFVLVSPSPLSQPMLQRVAGQLREPVLAAISTFGESLRLSFAGPNGSHPGAGHSAHAAAHVALSHLRPRDDRLEFTLDDDRRMVIARDEHGPAVQWPVMPYSETDQIAAVRDCIGVEPLETYSASFGLVAVVRSSAEVAGIVTNLEAIARLDANTLMVTARDEGGDFAIRVFAPRIGLPEDPVCGTAHRIIVPMWSKRLGKHEMISRQLSPRGGRLFCRLGEGTVTLSGAATPFFSGTIQATLA